MRTTNVQEFFQQNVDDLLQAQDHKRIKSDAKRIKRIRSLVAQTKIGKALLEWADENDIQMLMDHQTDAGGYYVTGFNCVALNATLGDVYLAGTLAHELRHAWQDNQDMIPCLQGADAPDDMPPQEVGDYMTQIKFLEADAFAVGETVRKILHFNQDETRKEDAYLAIKGEIYERRVMPDFEAPDAMAKEFTAFFTSGFKVPLYENRSLACFAKVSGVPDIEIPCSKTEYIPPKLKSPHAVHGIDVNDKKQVYALGNLLGAGNYMHHLPSGFYKLDVYRHLHLGGEQTHDASAKPFLRSDKVLFRYLQNMRK